MTISNKPRSHIISIQGIFNGARLSPKLIITDIVRDGERRRDIYRNKGRWTGRQRDKEAKRIIQWKKCTYENRQAVEIKCYKQMVIRLQASELTSCNHSEENSRNGAIHLAKG